MLISFEGLDGSGKETQTKIIEKRLNDSGFKCVRIGFPDYDGEYSIFVKKYLKGDFKQGLNPYLISVFFALDRFGVYKERIDRYLKEGYIVICDRYIHSNLIYQGSFIDNLDEKDKLFNWILDFEYNICNLPKQDMTLFMDMSLDINLNIIKSRANKDINEENEEFLIKCYSNAKYVSNKYNFINIKCDDGKKMYPIEYINDKIYNEILNNLNINKG